MPQVMFPKHATHGTAGQALAQAAWTSSSPASGLSLTIAWLFPADLAVSTSTTHLIGLSPPQTHIWAFPFALQVQIQISEIMNCSKLSLGLERAGPPPEHGSVAPHDNPPLICTSPEESLNPQGRLTPTERGQCPIHIVEVVSTKHILKPCWEQRWRVFTSPFLALIEHKEAASSCSDYGSQELKENKVASSWDREIKQGGMLM